MYQQRYSLNFGDDDSVVKLNIKENVHWTKMKITQLVINTTVTDSTENTKSGIILKSNATKDVLMICNTNYPVTPYNNDIWSQVNINGPCEIYFWFITATAVGDVAAGTMVQFIGEGENPSNIEITLLIDFE